MQRQSRGEPPLPEEDLSKLFKPPQPPARMDSLLIAGIVAPCKTWLVLFVAQEAEDSEKFTNRKARHKS